MQIVVGKAVLELTGDAPGASKRTPIERFNAANKVVAHAEVFNKQLAGGKFAWLASAAAAMTEMFKLTISDVQYERWVGERGARVAAAA